jgi:septum site-determining protein MinD
MLNIDDMTDILAIKLIGIVPEDERIVVSTNRGEPVILDENSKAGQAFKNISRRILGEEVPYMELNDDNEGFLNKLKKIFFKN